jgi:hypothetical protein
MFDLGSEHRSRLDLRPAGLCGGQFPIFESVRWLFFRHRDQFGFEQPSIEIMFVADADRL